MFVAVLAVAGGAIYFSIPQPDLPDAAAALASTESVEFEVVGGDLEFRPKSRPADIPETAGDLGLILYPGGKVDAAAYAPTARAIAAHGFLVVITPMPLNLAVLDVDAATRVVERHPEIEGWAIGGHSLGGSMAAEYVRRQPHVINGLVLWSSYSATDLSTLRLHPLLVYGSLDAGAARMTSQDSLGKLPLPVVVRRIDGGNHEQMGWYTGQPNDPPATITRADQQAQLVAATVDFLETLVAGTGVTSNVRLPLGSSQHLRSVRGVGHGAAAR
ncbi:MAG TPA: alpha/beta hydrolase [Candidatus Limnocylindria bacterium]|nr:alpha/beta hydrolase [Candidatus Limnocylindria bacterium]